jgi:hypothetical protein
MGGVDLMPFPFTADYRWGSGKGIAQRHFATAEREHQDLCDMARVLNNLKIVGVPETESPSIEKSGATWTIKIPCKVNTDEESSGIVVDNITFTPQQVSICVANQTKTMLILGSEPY